MKFIRIVLIILLVILILGSCSKNEKRKDEIYYGYEHESESTAEESSYRIEGQDILSDSFEMHIPDEYTVTKNGSSFIIENKDTRFDVNVEEHKYQDDNFEQYLTESIDKYREMGAEVSGPEAVTIGNYDMQRVKISFPMQAYGYYVDQREKGVLISIVLNNSKVSSEDVDKLIEEIELN
ncbi:MAG: hypothetical protein IKN56_00640 [Clostridia bacterium]|nr:hypothetical protein [Clostridia bacterium]